MQKELVLNKTIQHKSTRCLNKHNEKLRLVIEIPRHRAYVYTPPPPPPPPHYGDVIKGLHGFWNFEKSDFFHNFVYNSTTGQEYFPKVSSQLE